MRYMVEQGQITESRQNTVLSGCCAANLLTRLISVPTAQAETRRSVGYLRFLYSVEPL